MMNKLRELHNSGGVKDIAEEEAAIGHSGFSFFLGEHLFLSSLEGL